MLFYVVLGVILLVSIACIFLTKEKNGENGRAKLIKQTGVVVAILTFITIVVLSIVVIGCQSNTTVESLEMERVYLIYKVENNEYDSNIVKRIEQYNDGIKDAKKFIKNPFVGIFYTKAETEAEPICYEIKIIKDKPAHKDVTTEDQDKDKPIYEEDRVSDNILLENNQ